jgi:hypothetical protein
LSAPGITVIGAGIVGAGIVADKGGGSVVTPWPLTGTAKLRKPGWFMRHTKCGALSTSC